MPLYRPFPAALFCLAGLILLFAPMDASAALSHEGLFDNVLAKFNQHISSWGDVIKGYAAWLFWTLATISLVWTFGMMALRKADIGEFFAELVRFAIFVGFFWWLLDNGPTFAKAIIDSLMQIGGKVNQNSGFSAEFTPSGIVGIGFVALGNSIDNFSGWSIVDGIAGFFLSLGILIVMTLIAVNMLLLLVSAWILSYAGVFLLGFGGSRWTSEIAVNYYKTVLGIAVQIMTMLLLVGIGNALITDYYGKMNSGKIEIMETAVVFVVAIIIFVLSNKVPSIVSGIISGSGIGGINIGDFAGGAALGAAAGAVGGAAGLVTGAGKVAGATGKGVAATPGAALKAAAGATGAAKAVAALGDSLNQDAKRAGGGASAFMKATGIRMGNAVSDGFKGIQKAFKDNTGSSAGGKYASQTKASDAQKTRQHGG